MPQQLAEVHSGSTQNGIDTIAKDTFQPVAIWGFSK